MTNVYLVWEGSYEERTVVAVYATLEAAQAAHRLGHRPKWSGEAPYWRCEFRGKQHRAKVPVAWAFKTETIPVVDGAATLPDGRIVHTDSAFVSVPVLPSPTEFEIETTLGPSCDYDIEERPLG